MEVPKRDPHERRERDLLHSRSLAARVLLDVGHGEERAPSMHPTCAAGPNRSIRIEAVIAEARRPVRMTSSFWGGGPWKSRLVRSPETRAISGLIGIIR